MSDRIESALLRLNHLIRPARYGSSKNTEVSLPNKLSYMIKGHVLRRSPFISITVRIEIVYFCRVYQTIIFVCNRYANN